MTTKRDQHQSQYGQSDHATRKLCPTSSPELVAAQLIPPRYSLRCAVSSSSASSASSSSSGSANSAAFIYGYVYQVHNENYVRASERRSKSKVCTVIWMGSVGHILSIVEMRPCSMRERLWQMRGDVQRDARSEASTMRGDSVIRLRWAWPGIAQAHKQRPYLLS